jgi:hypothetical protein
MAISSSKSKTDFLFSSLHSIPAAFEAGGHGTPEVKRPSFILGVKPAIAIGVCFLQLPGRLLP